jgi:hypothetical protein
MQSILQFTNSHPWVMVYLSAVLSCILVRNQDITIALKREGQRTSEEQKRVKRGLGRSILLELLLFVPVSVTLVLFAVAPILEWALASNFSPLRNKITLNTLLGIASYGFPFATLRAIITKIALQTLSKYALLTHKSIENSLLEGKAENRS